MTPNKYIFVGLVLIVFGVFIFLGYVYYDSTKPLKEVVSVHNPILDSPVKKTQESNFHPESTFQPLTLTALSVATKTIVSKQDYLPTEMERFFYQKIMDSLKPKRIPEGQPDDKILWKRETYKTFPPRAPYPATIIKDLPMITKAYNESPSDDLLETKNGLEELLERYNKAVFDSKQYYQDMITNLGELVRQCPNSPFQPHYQETINLVIQMQKEDEEFYDKYSINYNIPASWNPTDVCYKEENYYSITRQVPIDEKIKSYTYCLRYSYFHKSDGQYTMEFGDGMDRTSLSMSSKEPILSAEKLITTGVPHMPPLTPQHLPSDTVLHTDEATIIIPANLKPVKIAMPNVSYQEAAPAVPALIKLLEDRQPIIAVDEDKIPSRFYRYQDAAVEILQTMFSPEGIKMNSYLPLAQCTCYGHLCKGILCGMSIKQTVLIATL